MIWIAHVHFIAHASLINQVSFFRVSFLQLNHFIHHVVPTIVKTRSRMQMVIFVVQCTSKSCNTRHVMMQHATISYPCLYALRSLWQMTWTFLLFFLRAKKFFPSPVIWPSCDPLMVLSAMNSDKHLLAVSNTSSILTPITNAM